MAQRFMRQPGESDRAAYARLEAEYEVIWAAYSEIKATVDRAAEVKAAALRAEDNLIKIVAKWSETGFPQAVQQERRRPNCQMDRWRIGEWAAFFHNHFNELVTAVQIGEAGAAGAELIRLREQVATLQQALSAAQEEARVRAAEAQDLLAKSAMLQQVLEQRQQAAGPPAPPDSRSDAPAEAARSTAPSGLVAGGDQADGTAEPSSLSEKELVERHGEYWTGATRATVDRIIGVLAAGQHFTSAGILQQLGLKYDSRPNRAAFVVLREQGFVDTLAPKTGLGCSIPIYFLTDRGEALAGDLGHIVVHRLSELVGRHGEAQSVVVLKTMDVLEGWGYSVDLWPGTLRTPAGQQIRPDLIATHPEEGTIYVEVELYGYTKSRDKKRTARLGKWRGNLDANGGTIYVACPQDRSFADVQSEIGQWIQEATRDRSLPQNRQVILMGMVVAKPGLGWKRIGLREFRR